MLEGRPRARAALALAGVLTSFGLYSIWLGQDASWDQRQYHVYDAYALLHGRSARDLAPAGLQTFLPPFASVPFYVLARHWPPRLAGFVLGVLHGTNAVLAFFVARSLLVRDARHRNLLAAVAAAVGGWAPAAMSELGTSFDDNVVSLFVVASLLCFVRRASTLTGLLCGAAVGLKYTSAIYALALVGAAAWSSVRRRMSPGTPLRLAAGIALGAIAVDGPWAWHLWRAYGNPVFPFFNGVFRSPYWMASNFIDPRWVPLSAWDGLAYPFYFVWTQAQTIEMPFRDVRWAVLVVLALACGGRWLAGRFFARARAEATVQGSDAASSIGVFGVLAFLIWDFAFGYHRYLVPLELVSGSLLLVACGRLCRRECARVTLFVSLSAMVVSAVRIPDWGRLPWGPTWFGVRVEGGVPARAMVLLLHPAPLSYVAPFFPPSVRFVKLEITGPWKAFGPSLVRDVEAAVASHVGPFFLLVRGDPSAHDRATLARYALEVTERCRPVASRFDPDLQLCAVARTPQKSDGPRAEQETVPFRFANGNAHQGFATGRVSEGCATTWGRANRRRHWCGTRSTACGRR